MMLTLLRYLTPPAPCTLSSAALLEKPTSCVPPATSPVMDTHQVPSSPQFPPSCPGTPPTTQDDGWRQAGLRGAAAAIKTSPTGVAALVLYCHPICRLRAEETKLSLQHLLDAFNFSHFICFVDLDAGRAAELCVRGIGLADLAAHDRLLVQTWCQEAPGSPEPLLAPSGCREQDGCSPDDLNSKFRSHCLHSSSSSSSSSSAYEMTQGPGSTQPALRSVCELSPLSRSPSTSNPFPKPPGTAAAQHSGASMTLPKVRTPLAPRDSIQLVKKHSSQPQPSLERLHLLSVDIDMALPNSACSTLKGAAASPFSQLIEETDIDEALLDSMDGEVGEGPGPRESEEDGVSFVGLAEELDRLDPEVLKPPTPPLHRFPSWVRQSDCCFLCSH